MKHLAQIHVLTRPAKAMNYPTGGDYGVAVRGHWWIHLAENSRWEYEALVLVHELVEMILTKQRKISWDKITKFDTDNLELDDPGTDKRAPYHKEHMFATKIEKQLCKELGLDWETYDQSFDKLKY